MPGPLRRLVVWMAVAIVLGGDVAHAEQPPTAADLQFFTDVIEPIFADHCYKCHGNGQQKGGLTFYARAGLLQGGDSGSAVDLEQPAESLLLQAVNYESYEMPPAGKLPQEQRDRIAEWIARGAPMPERQDVIHAHAGVPQVNDETRNHWAFRHVERPQVPAVDGRPWAAGPIDAFILEKLIAAELSPNPPADRQVLARRVYYDLTGLPPTAEELEEFLADVAPNAYERLVDRLLNSPRYGEHAARYWLDLVRYAESNSFERDNPKPFVWRYRDYVIQAFNSDKTYDQFLTEQLAGDELPEVTPETIIATGYYRLGPWDDEPADPEQALFDELDDLITTTGQGLLGLTLNCARCHDHKLDPLPQADYYRFLSFFHNIRRYGIRAESTVYERSIREIATVEEKAAQADELADYQRRLDAVRRELDEIEEALAPQLPGGERDDFKAESVRPAIIKKYAGTLVPEDAARRYASQFRKWSEMRKRPPRSGALALAVKEHGPEAPATHVLIRGNHTAPGDVVSPGFPEVLSPPAPEIEPPRHGESTGRRLALARWIASVDNPLTARVMVNRLWQWRFDRGLVNSPNNFGLQGDLPTHPELLDWLAAEFMSQGWSLKQVHRRLLLSETYQQSSAGNPRAAQLDPQNSLRWRFDSRRLRAEEVRDSILAVTQSLQDDVLYGPSVYPPLPAAVHAGQSRPGENWPTSPAGDRDRRSVYIHVKRSLQVPLLANFDVADTDFTCPQRFATTQPTQALGMLNSEFVNEQAQVFAADLKRVAVSPREQIALALARATQRAPQAAEVDRGMKLYQDLQREHGQSPDLALQNFCLLALNLNEFLYLD